MSTSRSPFRYAWVLAGRHPQAATGSTPAPRAEFEVFLERFGGELLSRSSLDETRNPLASSLRRAGMPCMGLASLVQSRSKSFDAIIASGEDIGLPIAIASLAGRRRTPLHMMFHGHHLESRKLLMLAPTLRELEHVHFHCLSESLRERTQAVLGIPASRCHATGYGVGTCFFTEAAANGSAMIASAGAANRDYATLATAVRDLPVTVCIAADSTWMPQTVEVPVTDWPNNVHVRSYGDYVRLRELYGKSRFVVVPLHPARHACGYAVIGEAMAMGRAVVATRTDAPPDFIIPGTTGLFVEAYDVKALRNHICNLLSSPAYAEEIGHRARAIMVERHSLEHFCDRFERIVADSIRRDVAV